MTPTLMLMCMDDFKSEALADFKNKPTLDTQAINLAPFLGKQLIVFHRSIFSQPT